MSQPPGPIGYIPNTVVYFLRGGVHTTSVPAFPVSGALDPSAKTWDIANKWCGHGSDQNAVRIEEENRPLEGYRIVGAEQRGGGGRAWKVVQTTTPIPYAVDLREDVFLPILLEKGLPASGIIDAQFQWCMKGSQLRLEQVGSEAHAQYVTEDEWLAKKRLDTTARIAVRDLQVGHVYMFPGAGGSWHSRRYLGQVRVKGNSTSKVKTLWTFGPLYTTDFDKEAESLTVMTGSRARRKADECWTGCAPEPGLTPSRIEALLRRKGVRLVGFPRAERIAPENVLEVLD